MEEAVHQGSYRRARDTKRPGLHVSRALHTQIVYRPYPIHAHGVCSDLRNHHILFCTLGAQSSKTLPHLECEQQGCCAHGRMCPLSFSSPRCICRKADVPHHSAALQSSREGSPDETGSADVRTDACARTHTRTHTHQRNRTKHICCLIRADALAN